MAQAVSGSRGWNSPVIASMRSCSVTMPCSSPYSSITKAICTSERRKLSSSSMPVMVSGTYKGVCSGCSDSSRAVPRMACASHCRAFSTPCSWPRLPLTTGKREWLLLSTRAMFTSNGSSRSSTTTSLRGTISEPIWRSSSRNTLRTMVCSCDSITPALVPSASMAWISSSVTALALPSLTPSRRSSARVDTDSRITNGLVALDSQSMGRATRRASDSG